ncbi:MAG: HEPN domain-containing protein [Bacillota bacterium]
MLSKSEWIKSWLAKATNDLKTAERIIDSDDPLSDIACYHSQQCAEKALKAFLTSKEVTFEKTHDLVALNVLCRKIDAKFIEINETCILLMPYAVETCYPGSLDGFSVDEARNAIQNARIVLDFVVGKLTNS